MASYCNFKGLCSFSSSATIPIIAGYLIYVEFYTSLDKLFPDSFGCLLPYINFFFTKSDYIVALVSI